MPARNASWRTELTPGCCCAVETADSVFCFFSTMLLSSVESSGSGRLGPSVAMVSDHTSVQRGNGPQVQLY